MEVVYSHPFRADGIEIRATPDISKYLRNLYVAQGNRPLWTPAVADSIDAGNYEFVKAPGFDKEITLDTIYTLPRKVAVIIDGNTMSSAEQFIIFCKECSDRTTIYGKDNSMGTIDFSNLRRFDMACSGLSIQVPMSRSTRLSRGEFIDGIGMVPDVRINLPLPTKLTDNIDEWVLWVANQM